MIELIALGLILGYCYGYIHHYFTVTLPERRRAREKQAEYERIVNERTRICREYNVVFNQRTFEYVDKRGIPLYPQPDELELEQKS